MGEESGFWVERVSKMGSLSDRLNRFLRTCEKMPTLSGSLTTVTGYGRSFLSCCDFWRIARIETDEDDLIVFPWVEGNPLQRVDDPLLQSTAQHWAVVVDKCKKHGFSSKVFAELDIAASFILKSQIERHLGVQWRVKAHVNPVRWERNRRDANIWWGRF